MGISLFLWICPFFFICLWLSLPSTCITFGYSFGYCPFGLSFCVFPCHGFGFRSLYGNPRLRPLVQSVLFIMVWFWVFVLTSSHSLVLRRVFGHNFVWFCVLEPIVFCLFSLYCFVLLQVLFLTFSLLLLVQC